MPIIFRLMARYGFWLAIILAITSYFVILPPQEIMQADTSSYLEFHASRTIGYPVFLWLIPFKLVPHVQLLIFALAAGVFAQRVKSLIGPFFTLFALVLILAHPEIAKYHFQAMTESLAISLLLLIISEWVLISQNASSASLIRLGVWLGLSLLIRPSAYGLLAIVFTALLNVRRWRQVLNIIVPVILLIQVGSFANYKIHGFWGTQSFLGHNLIGKVTFLMDEKIQAPAPYEELARAVKPIQDTVAQSKTLQQRILLSNPYYDITRFTLLPKFFDNAHDWNREWQQMSLATIRANPLGYIEDVLINYMCLWYYPQLLTPAQMFEFEHFISSISPLSYMEKYPFTLKVFPAWLLSTVRLGFLVVFCLSLGYLLSFMLRRRNPCITTAAGLSIMIHANYFITAGVQAGLTRYAVFMIPAIVLIGSIFCYQLWTNLKGRI